MKLIYITSLILLTSISSQVYAQKCPIQEDKHLINTDEKGQNIAMEGYDIVEYFNTKQEKGNPNFTAVYQGINYLFISENNKNSFEAKPEKYLPQYGGFCAVAASFGKAEELQTYDLYEVKDGKLYFSKNSKAHKLWTKNPDKVIGKANEKWPCIVKDLGLKIEDPYKEPTSIK